MLPIKDVLEERYPKKAQLEDGSPVTIRHLVKEDEAALTKFFNEIPKNDISFLREDISNPQVIQEWCHNINYTAALPILAFSKDNEIVADATLHMQNGGWMSHIGRVRIVVHPKARKKGLASILVKEIMKIGFTLGLDKLDAEFMAEQEGPVAVFEKLGFEKTAILPDHVRDIEGKNHDLVILIYNLRQPEYFAAD
jgi:RimJ/RimL family protein N-acetyltransferase